MLLDGDNPGTQVAFQYAMYVGSENQFRAWRNSTAPPTRPFRFNFAGGQAQGWYSGDSRMKRENGSMVFYVGDSKTDQGQVNYGATLFSPAVSWSAASMPKLYVNVAVTGTSELRLVWLKAGQTESTGIAVTGGTIPATCAQYVNFPVIGDGVMRTYEVTLNTNQHWNGTIAQVRIGNPFDPNNNYQWKPVSAAARVRLGWVSTENVPPAY